MHKDSLRILSKYNLNTPKQLNLDNIPNDKTRLYYLRFSRESNKKSFRVNGEYINHNINELKKELITEKLIGIELTYNIIFGGATLIKNDFCYSEIVKGHPVALLRRGLCGMRVIFENSKIWKKNVFQSWQAEQDLGYKYYPSKGFESELNDELMKLKELLNFNHRGMLLEWFYTENGFVFCDARETFENFGNDLINIKSTLQPNIPNVLEKIKNNDYIIDAFDIDTQITYPSVIIANRGAILSHYITRANIYNNIIKLF